MKQRLPLSRWTKHSSKTEANRKKDPAPAVETKHEKLRQDEARLEALINSIDQIILELDADGTFLNIWANDDQLLYRPRNELLGRRSEDIFDPEFFRSSHELFKRVIATGKGEDFEYSLDLPAGQRWFLARVNRIQYPDGDKTVCVAVRDITDRKRAEENLRISEEKFSKAFRAGPDAIALSTLDDGRILDVNYNFLRLTGFARGESIGRTWPTPRNWSKWC
jgi:PAS domain S-box-containing protein